MIRRQAFCDCAHVFAGRADVNGQEHLYIETQGAYAYPVENGGIHITSSTQGPTVVQKAAARVLGGTECTKWWWTSPGSAVDLAGRKIRRRRGGVFAALASQHTGEAVKMTLHRLDDMRMTGKRHPYSADYRIGLDADLRIVAYEVDFYQNAGAVCDLSPAVLERSLFHATNSYFIPNVAATGLLLPDQPSPQHRIPRFWRAAGDVRDRIGHRCGRQRPSE